MLTKISNPDIKSFERIFRIREDIFINTRVIYNKEFTGKKALFLHGGVIYGDLTLAVRPAEWLLNDNLFDAVILPDRRGAGKSSLFSKPVTIEEQSEDLHLLLNAMEINEKITVISNSYGGLLALLLANIDDRIEKVVLAASSPTLDNASFILRLLEKTGLLKVILKLIVRTNTGRLSPVHIDQDEFYDLKTKGELLKMALKVLKHTGRNELTSMYFRIDSLLDRHNVSIPHNLKLNIPVIQIIGDRDEFWGKDIPEIYKKNFPLLKRSIIKDASHNDLILKADVFYAELTRLLREEET